MKHPLPYTALLLVDIFLCSQVHGTSLVPRPSTPPVFDRLQYAKTEGEGLGNLFT